MTEYEWQTRKERIDKKLKSLNPPWKIIKYSDGLDTKGLHRYAVEEFLTANGPADSHSSEQYEIVRRVEELFAHADRIEVRYQKAKTQVDKLTQSILAKAFRGELVPQDPNDEPASELLRHIKDQKVEHGHPQAAPGEKRQRHSLSYVL